MPESTVKEIFNTMCDHFDAEAAKGINARIQFLLSGEQAAEYAMEIVDQTCKVSEGRVGNPNLTLKADAELATKVLSGEVDGMKAYLMGKLKLIGDISLALKLIKLFSK